MLCIFFNSVSLNDMEEMCPHDSEILELGENTSHCHLPQLYCTLYYLSRDECSGEN